MMPRLRAVTIILVVCVGVIGAQTVCPSDDPELVGWNTASAWQGGRVPQADQDATITGKVLLNQQPPTLKRLTVAPGAKLVFDPDTNVHLTLRAIFVEGEFWIGSEDCLFTGKARITFIGNVGEEKIFQVQNGGSIELHGPRKLSWSKLAQTAPKFDALSSSDVLEGRDELDFCNDRCSRGLLVYQLNRDTGALITAARFDFLVENDEINERILQFVEYLVGIPAGTVVGLAIKKEIVDPSKSHNIDTVFDAIEALTGQSTLLRNVDSGSAYSLLMVKDEPGSVVEEFEPNTGGTHTVTAKGYFNNFAYVLESLVNNDGGGCGNTVTFRVYDDAIYRPTIELLDDALNWQSGDKLVIASTDYDPDQAEEVEVLSTNGKFVRLAAPLQYTHYGEIYNGVDLRGEVGLLSRPVKIDSIDADDSEFYGGHIKIAHHFGSAHIEGVELENLGQQEFLGAYSVHFHMCGRTENNNNPWIRQNSIHHTNSRCVTIHNTMGILIEDNVCYKSVGHSYFLEDGSEQNNTFNRNLGLGTERPPAGFGLIPTDNCPTTFWVTNPKNYYTNNAAAGSDCRGFWFNYPDYPLYQMDHMHMQLSEEWMLEKEARFTRIYQFDNNVAHSNIDAGLFVDNILNANGDETSTGYNKYRPMRDPVNNDISVCIQNQNNCVDDCARLKKFTGYKNSKRNYWGRGGCVIMEESGLADSIVGGIVLRDNPAVQFIERSIILGDTPNVGVPADGFTRSLPKSMDSNTIHIGIEVIKGPAYFNDNWFDGFKDNEKYNMGAIGFRRNNAARSSPRTAITNAQFGFSDPSEGNRVKDYSEVDELFTSRDGDDIANIRDLDGTLSDFTCSDPDQTVTVVRPEPFHLTPTSVMRPNWNMALTCGDFGEVRVADFDSTADTDIVRMVRDDDPTAHIESDMESSAPFLVLLGGQYSYSINFQNVIPATVKIQTRGVSFSGYVRIGVCLPRNMVDGNYGLKVFHPASYKDITKWTRVNTLAEIDQDTTGGKYFYHEASGYFATILRNKNDYAADELIEDPQNKAITLTIDLFIPEADRTGFDCLPDARNALGDLSPQTSTKRSVISLLRRLLQKTRRTKRSTPPTVYNTELAADSPTPPQGYGASSSHTLFTGATV